MPKSSSASRTPAPRSSLSTSPTSSTWPSVSVSVSSMIRSRPRTPWAASRSATMRGNVGSSRLRGEALTATGASTPSSPPAQHRRQRLVEHRLGEGRQQPRALDRGEEPARVEVAALGVVPAGQRLGGDHVAGGEVDDGLERRP